MTTHPQQPTTHNVDTRDPTGSKKLKSQDHFVNSHRNAKLAVRWPALENEKYAQF